MTRQIWRMGLTLALLANGVGLAQAQPGGDRFAACRGIADPAARLSCYDATRAPQPPLADSPRGDAATWPEFGRPVSAPPPSPARIARPEAGRLAAKIAANIVAYQVYPTHRFEVTLENGQVWRQLASDDGRAQFRVRGANRVVITRGFWNSYDLKLNSMSAVFKVVRVR